MFINFPTDLRRQHYWHTNTDMLYECISHPTMGGGGHRSVKVGFQVKNLNQKVPTGDDIPPIFVRLRQRLGMFRLDRVFGCAGGFEWFVCWFIFLTRKS